MATNQTQIFTETVPTPTTTGATASLYNAVNSFVTTGISSGYINFHILPVVVTAVPGTTPPIQFVFTVQVDYYNPAIM